MLAETADLRHETTYQRKLWAPIGSTKASLPAVQHCGIFMTAGLRRDDGSISGSDDQSAAEAGAPIRTAGPQRLRPFSRS
jgi:hypothetical protein